MNTNDKTLETPRATILLVDDDPINLTTLGSVLHPQYEVLPAPSGERALQVAAGAPKPDLILLDVLMPGMDGYDVLARLRDNPATRDIPVIFVTGLDSSEDEEKSLELGAVDYIAKPYRPATILARVHAQLELKRARDFLADHNRILEEQVAARTAELRESREKLRLLNESLERRVQEELAKNREKDLLLVQQSRLSMIGEIIHNVSHHWRQPLNAVGLILANIKDAYEFNELSQEYFDKEVALGQRLIEEMSATIDIFRAFFRPDGERQNFCVCDAVDDAVGLLDPAFKNANIEIEFERSREAHRVLAYRGDFARVVLNVLTNARDALVRKHIAGKIRIKAEERGKTIIVSITDNGGGVPAEVLDKIFDPSSLTRITGHGLGLYLAKMIMNHMDGDITLHNAGDGAEVLLTLPLEVWQGKPE